MNERTKTGLEILQVAVVLGVLGDVLLRQTPWGLNALLFNVAFAAGVLVLLRRHAARRLTGTAYALVGALVFFASMFVWRDSIELRIADTFAIIAILGVLFLPTLKISARSAGVAQYAIGVVWAAVNSLFAAGALVGSDIRWNALSTSGWRRHALAVFRGVLIATPLLIVFGALFVAADAVYEGWIKQVFNVDFENLFSHMLLLALFGWLTAGYFRGMVFNGAAAAATSLPITVPEETQAKTSPIDDVRAESGEHPITLPGDRSVIEHLNISDPPNAEVETPSGDLPSTETKTTWSWANIDNSLVPGFTLGTVEVGVILGLINLLFLSFVIVQVPYLFGGMEFVQNTPDFKLAEYARRGFGELVAVAALVLPMLLGGHWLLKKDKPAAGMLFRILAGIQIALLFVIMASAVQRLVLLTGNLGYGMTTVRLYPMIFMTWLAVLFVWFVLTVLRGKRQYFAWGALWSAFLILGAAHVLNPDQFIVRHNLALMREGREFDAAYNSQLSDDAVPELFYALEELNAEDQTTTVQEFGKRLCQKREEIDLRSLNISRMRATAILNSSEALVAAYGDCDPAKLQHTDHPD